MDIQEETGFVYNLEATPAEGTSFRLALKDKTRYPDIVTAGNGTPYYTNSTQVPVGFGSDLFEVLDMQDDLQSMYTGGTVLHLYLGESIDDPEICRWIETRRWKQEMRVSVASAPASTSGGGLTTTVSSQLLTQPLASVTVRL